MRVAVVKGGRSFEREVSLQGARRVEAALRELGHDVVGLELDHAVVDNLRGVAPDFVFIAAHGRGGEDGSLQELLEMLGLPYTGSDSLASSLCMNKALAKRLIGAAGIPTPAFHAFDVRAFKELGAARAFDACIRELGLPLVVKPANEGSSMGIRFAGSHDELRTAALQALAYDDHIIIERKVVGRELAVTILGQPGATEVLPIVEVRPKADFYSYEAHYDIGQAELLAPAELTDAERGAVEDVAQAVYATLRCRDFARVDLILDADGVPQVLEVNTIPGFTDTGPMPFAADAANLSFRDLVDRITERVAR